MKNFTISLMLVLCICGSASAQQQVVSYPGYTAYWNPVTLIPDSVIWVITKDHLTGQKIPRANRFHPEKWMPNLKRDYAGSHYDQGHNSPYDDNYWSKDAEYQCFSYVNMFPQLHVLNAQTWERLEDYSRKMALQYGSCYVKTYWQGIDKKIGPDSIAVPLWCVKTIKYNGISETYKMPNRDTVVNHDFSFYKVK